MASFCPDCQEPLDSVAVGQPCPGCGGTRRSATLFPDPVRARASIPVPLVRAMRPANATREDYQALAAALRIAQSGPQRPGQVAEEVRRGSPKFESLADWLSSQRSQTLATWLSVILMVVLHMLDQRGMVVDAHVEHVDVHVEQPVDSAPLTDDQVRDMIDEALQRYDGDVVEPEGGG